MPSGIIHEILNFFIAFLVAAFLFEQNYLWPIPAKVFFGLAILSLLFSPDLDVKSRPLNRWGIFKVIWFPFVVAGHRRILHNLVLGPLILCLVPGIIMWVKFEDLWVVAGLALSVVIHILTDRIVTGVKREIPFCTNFH